MSTTGCTADAFWTPRKRVAAYMEPIALDSSCCVFLNITQLDQYTTIKLSVYELSLQLMKNFSCESGDHITNEFKWSQNMWPFMLCCKSIKKQKVAKMLCFISGTLTFYAQDPKTWYRTWSQWRWWKQNGQQCMEDSASKTSVVSIGKQYIGRRRAERMQWGSIGLWYRDAVHSVQQ